VEFRNRLAATLRRPLSATLVFEHPTIGALAEFLDGDFQPAKKPSQRDPLLEELKALSEEEAQELLEAELDRI
jgi:hypothetical protein